MGYAKVKSLYRVDSERPVKHCREKLREKLDAAHLQENILFVKHPSNTDESTPYVHTTTENDVMTVVAATADDLDNIQVEGRLMATLPSDETIERLYTQTLSGGSGPR